MACNVAARPAFVYVRVKILFWVLCTVASSVRSVGRASWKAIERPFNPVAGVSVRAILIGLLPPCLITATLPTVSEAVCSVPCASLVGSLTLPSPGGPPPKCSVPPAAPQPP